MTETRPATAYGHQMRVPVYFDDLDALGSVYHGRFSALLDRALSPYWAALGYITDSDRPGPDTVQYVRELSLTYLKPIRQVGEVICHFWANHVGRTSLEWGFRFLSLDATTVHVEGRRSMVNFDPLTGRPTPWTDAGREELVALLREPPAAT